MGKKNEKSAVRRAPAGDVNVKQPVAWFTWLLAVVLIVGLVGGVLWFARGNNPQTPPSSGTPAAQPNNQPAAQGQAKQWSEAPAMQIDTKKQYQAVVTTDQGSFTIDLWPAKAPQTVNSFVFLARQHFYDGIIFHRIIQSFMVQTGDPKGNGTGGPGYTLPEELPPPGSYEPGIVAMARTQLPHSAGSQFFICSGTDCAKFLDRQPNYTQFGRVSQGMDVVQKIAATPVQASANGEPSQPITPPVIQRIDIIEK